MVQKKVFKLSKKILGKKNYRVVKKSMDQHDFPNIFKYSLSNSIREIVENFREQIELIESKGKDVFFVKMSYDKFVYKAKAFISHPCEEEMLSFKKSLKHLKEEIKNV